MPSHTLVLAALASATVASYVRLPFDRHAAAEARGYKVRRQASNVANLPMGGIAFVGNTQPTHFNASIGTPPQPMYWGIDTGSHLAILSGTKNSTNCGPADCFDTTASSSFQAQPEVFAGSCGESFLGGSISADASTNSTETLHLGDIDLEGWPVCINQNGEGNGIIGLNFNNNGDGTGTYPDILANLRNGHIDRASIALWLNDFNGDGAEITFGGVDSTRYEGGLTQMKLQPEVNPPGYANMRAPLTGFGLTDVQGNAHSLVPEGWSRAPGLDTGSSGISVPLDMYNSLFAALGVVNTTDPGWWQGTAASRAVPCDLANSPATLDFTYGDSVTFNTPLAAWIGAQFPSPIIMPNGTVVPACQLLIDPDEGDNGNFGTPIQQFMYLVWDYENKNVALGKARRGTITDAPNVTPIPSGTDIPGVTSTATATGTVVITNTALTVQSVAQTTTVVGNGTTGLVYSTPLYDLGVGNAFATPSSLNMTPTSTHPTISPPLNTSIPVPTGHSNATISIYPGPYGNVTSTPLGPSAPIASTPCPDEISTTPGYGSRPSSSKGWLGSVISSSLYAQPSSTGSPYKSGPGSPPGAPGSCGCQEITDLESRIAKLEALLI